MNHTKEIAEMLGIEIGKRFKTSEHGGRTFHLEEDGLWDDEDLFCPTILVNLLIGKYETIKIPWKPKRGDSYFYYSVTYMSAFRETFIGTSFDLSLCKIGNCFKTKEEAETKGKEIIEQIRKEYIEA